MQKHLNKNAQSPAWLKALVIFVGISGCFSVLFGAWLAHGGQSLAPSAQSSLVTALQYQFIHSLALLACLIWASVNTSSKWLITAIFCFFIGILLFCGTIYIKIFFDLPSIGKLTPMGGISFAIAWLLLAVEGKTNL